MTGTTSEKLLQMKSQIDKAKNEEAETRGKKQTTQEQMKSKFGVDTVEAAEKELKSRAADLDKMEDEFEKGVTELIEKFPLEN